MLRCLLLLHCLCFLVLSGCAQSSKTPEEKQEVASQTEKKPNYKDCNVVFVSFDALQAAHVGCLGYDRDVTPNIDAMAKQSTIFANNYSVASWTVPSTMTWFTGVYPSEHRMVNKYAQYDAKVRKQAKLKEMAPSIITLADILKKQGYVTGGFTGNAGVSGGFGYEQGFDVYYFPKGVFGGMTGSVPRALDWLKKNREKKFFLFLHGYDVHGQYLPPGGYDFRFVAKDYDKRYTGSPLEQEILREEGLEKGQLTLRAADVAFWRAIYDEKIQRVDAQFGKFLKAYKELGLEKNTIFILTSDHGTEVYEHRRFDHGFTLYDELVHVPLIIHTPGQNESKKVTQNVSSIDIMPTILDLLEIPLSENVKKQLRGGSLKPVINGKKQLREVYSETDYREYTYKRSVITPDGWKLIYTLEDNTRELFHLSSDPHEQNNLAKANAKKADELQEKVFSHFRSIGHDLTERRWIKGLNPVYPSQGRN